MSNNVQAAKDALTTADQLLENIRTEIKAAIYELNTFDQKRFNDTTTYMTVDERYDLCNLIDRVISRLNRIIGEVPQRKKNVYGPARPDLDEK